MRMKRRHSLPERSRRCNLTSAGPAPPPRRGSLLGEDFHAPGQHLRPHRHHHRRWPLVRQRLRRARHARRQRAPQRPEDLHADDVTRAARSTTVVPGAVNRGRGRALSHRPEQRGWPGSARSVRERRERVSGPTLGVGSTGCHSPKRVSAASRGTAPTRSAHATNKSCF